VLPGAGSPELTSQRFKLIFVRLPKKTMKEIPLYALADYPDTGALSVQLVRAGSGKDEAPPRVSLGAPLPPQPLPAVAAPAAAGDFNVSADLVRTLREAEGQTSKSIADQIMSTLKEVRKATKPADLVRLQDRVDDLRSLARTLEADSDWRPADLIKRTMPEVQGIIDARRVALGGFARMGLPHIQINEVSDGALTVSVPYNPQSIDKLKSLGCTWEKRARVWVCPKRSARSLRAWALETFGSDGSPVPLVDVEFTFNKTNAFNPFRTTELVDFGRVIAERKDRGSPVEFGEGVDVETDLFLPTSDGRGNIQGEGSVLIVRDVARSLAVERASAAPKNYRVIE